MWTDTEEDALYRSNLDGSSVTKILDLTTIEGEFRDYDPFGITTDGNKLFWTDRTLEAIFTSNLDGTNAAELIDFNAAFGNSDYRAREITTDGHQLFWVDHSQDSVYRANLDGTNAIQLIDLEATFGNTGSTSGYTPLGITNNGSQIFWTDAITDSIYQANLDGTGATQLISLDSALGDAIYVPRSITTDGNSLFWTDSFFSNEDIYSASIDGTGVTKITELGPSVNPTGITTNGSKLFWLAAVGQTVNIANLDGTGISTIVDLEAEFGMANYSPQAITIIPDTNVVPEPLTILGAGTAVAFGTGFKRKLAKTKKK